MRDGTHTKAGLLADAGASRPRSVMSNLGVNACAWRVGPAVSTKPAYQFADIATHFIRRLQESSQ